MVARRWKFVCQSFKKKFERQTKSIVVCRVQNLVISVVLATKKEREMCFNRCLSLRVGYLKTHSFVGIVACVAAVFEEGEQKNRDLEKTAAMSFARPIFELRSSLKTAATQAIGSDEKDCVSSLCEGGGCRGGWGCGRMPCSQAKFPTRARNFGFKMAVGHREGRLPPVYFVV